MRERKAAAERFWIYFKAWELKMSRYLDPKVVPTGHRERTDKRKGVKKLEDCYSESDFLGPISQKHTYFCI